MADVEQAEQEQDVVDTTSVAVSIAVYRESLKAAHIPTHLQDVLVRDFAAIFHGAMFGVEVHLPANPSE